MTLRTPDVLKIVDATEVKVENAIVDIVQKSTLSSMPTTLKAEIEKFVKDIVKNAIQELLVELKKTPLASLDANADGVISVTEAKEAAQKMCCAIV